MRESLQVLDSIHLNFTPESLFILNLTLAFIMFGVALEIKPDHFRKVILNPKATIVGFFSQFFFWHTYKFCIDIIHHYSCTPGKGIGNVHCIAKPVILCPVFYLCGGEFGIEKNIFQYFRLKRISIVNNSLS